MPRRRSRRRSKRRSRSRRRSTRRRSRKSRRKGRRRSGRRTKSTRKSIVAMAWVPATMLIAGGLIATNLRAQSVARDEISQRPVVKLPFIIARQENAIMARYKKRAPSIKRSDVIGRVLQLDQPQVQIVAPGGLGRAVEYSTEEGSSKKKREQTPANKSASSGKDREQDREVRFDLT